MSSSPFILDTLTCYLYYFQCHVQSLDDPPPIQPHSQCLHPDDDDDDVGGGGVYVSALV